MTDITLISTDQPAIPAEYVIIWRFVSFIDDIGLRRHFSLYRKVKILWMHLLGE